MMKKKYDCVVIGAGPAGLMAARELSAGGQDVLLVDVKKDIEKVHRSCCTMLINEPNTHGETVRVVDNNLHFEKTGLTVRYTGKWVKLIKSSRLSPGGFKLSMINEKEGVALPYTKEVILKNLLDDAVANGTDVLTETMGVRAENVKGGVKVLLRSARSRTLQEVKCKIAIAADGVNSQIVTGLELFKTRKYLATYRVASYFLDDVDYPYWDSWITCVGKGHTRWKAGQVYMVPKYLPNAKEGDRPILDVFCGTPAGLPAKMALDEFLREGPFREWFTKAKIVHKAACVLNFYTCIVNPVEGNIMVVGDAAAFIETYCQSALMYGYRAAHAALKVLDKGTGYNAYTDFWRESFEYCWPGEIEKALQAFGLHQLTDEELDYIFGLTDDEYYPGFVSENTAPIIMKKAIMGHIDQIRKERPETARALEKHWKSSAEDIVQH
ncbi:FAD-dependent monooxygenase [Thermodesulfobacteriota bacterium]